MSAFFTWLGSLIEGILAPLIAKWISNMQINATVNSNQAQTDALIKAVAKLQTAKTPEDFENDIKAVTAADNLNSQ